MIRAPSPTSSLPPTWARISSADSPLSLLFDSVLLMEEKSEWVRILYPLIDHKHDFHSCVQLYLALCNPMGYSLSGSFVFRIIPARILESAAISCHFFLQEIILTQGLNPQLLHLLHFQADSLPLNHFGNSINMIKFS